MAGQRKSTVVAALGLCLFAAVAVSPAGWAAGPSPVAVVAAEVEFVDVPAGAAFYDDIQWLAGEGITRGAVGPDGSVIFGPADPITREAMAAFLYRFSGEPAFSAPDVSPFTDLAPGDAFYLEITWLADQGIEPGGGAFGPTDQVTREQQAVWIFRALTTDEQAAAYTPTGTEPFTDVDPTHPAYTEISWMWDFGLSTGADDGSGNRVYAPGDEIRREAMAAFFHRAANLTTVKVTLPVGSVTWLPAPAGLDAAQTVTAEPAVAGLAWTVSPDGLLELAATMDAPIGGHSLTLTGTGCVSTACERPFTQRVEATITGIAAPGDSPVATSVLPSPDRVAAAVPLEAIDGAELVDEVTLVLGTAQAPGSRADADAVADAVGAVVAGGMEDIGVFQLRWATPQDIDARVLALGALPGVEGVDRALVVADPTASTTMPPGDWNDDDPEATWPFEQMKAPEAWAVATGSSVPVGIVDGGLVDRGHPDLNVERSTNTTGARVAGHATHVAGLACAQANGAGLVGAAWGCPVITDSVTSAPGYTSAVVLSSAVGGARRVIGAGAKVVNMSLGFNLRNTGLYTGKCATQDAADWLDSYLNAQTGGVASAFRRLATTVGHDVVFTLAAGNDCIPSVGSPYALAADLDNVITVAAVNDDDTLASFSNWGGEVAAGGGVAVPSGTGVWSTLPDAAYGTDSGTSMAAPLVAGVAALIREHNPTMNAAEVGRCITDYAGTSTGQADTVSTYPTDFVPRVTGFPGGLPILDADAAVRCSDRIAHATAPGEYTLEFIHPAWGPVRLITRESTTPPGPASIRVIDSAGDIRYLWETDFLYDLQPAGTSPSEPWLFHPAAATAIDQLGHIFINWNPGRYNGVTVLQPTQAGFEDFDTPPDYLDTRFYYAYPVDIDNDGTFEIEDYTNDCNPSCAGGQITSEIFAWNGNDYTS